MKEAEENTAPELQKEVSDKYDLVGVKPGTYQFGGLFGTIDLTKVDLEEADALVRAEFPHLKLKDKKAATPAAPVVKP